MTVAQVSLLLDISQAEVYNMGTGYKIRRKTPIYSIIDAFGGTVYDFTIDDQDYRAHVFTSNGLFKIEKITIGSEYNIEYLIIGGGGSGGNPDRGAGGGAGGFRTNVQSDLSGANSNSEPGLLLGLGDYLVTVGEGGLQGYNGENSSFIEIVSLGGGTGGRNNLEGHRERGQIGGSGGGGGYTSDLNR